MPNEETMVRRMLKNLLKQENGPFIGLLEIVLKAVFIAFAAAVIGLAYTGLMSILGKNENSGTGMPPAVLTSVAEEHNAGTNASHTPANK